MYVAGNPGRTTVSCSHRQIELIGVRSGSRFFGLPDFPRQVRRPTMRARTLELPPVFPELSE